MERPSPVQAAASRPFLFPKGVFQKEQLIVLKPTPHAGARLQNSLMFLFLGVAVQDMAQFQAAGV
jgi:hypothetical protein